MQRAGENPLWQKKGAGFSFSSSVSMEGCEVYIPEPLETTCVIVLVTVEEQSEFRMIFNSEPILSRGTSKSVLCFVVGQDGNSRTTVREGNPGVILAETKEKRALFSIEKGEEKAFWFSFDAKARIAAFGLGSQPGNDSTLLVVPDWCGCFDQGKGRLFIGVANWKQPLKLSIVHRPTSSLGLNQYPDKFNDDKTLRSFPGVTYICRVNEKSHGAFVARALIRAQEILKATGPSVGGCYAFLPPDSFHMTLANLVTSQNRMSLCPEIHGDMGQIAQHLQQKIKEIVAMAASNVFYMKMNDVSVLKSLSVRLRPYEDKTAAAIAAWRNSMYTRLGFTYSKTYEFHITLAYQILPINESNARALLATTKQQIRNMLDESKQFALLPVSEPELCTFQDMAAFNQI